MRRRRSFDIDDCRAVHGLSDFFSSEEAGHQALDEMPDQKKQLLLERTPIGRFGKPEAVAAMVNWLASDDVSYSTGAIFDLSGGRATY